MKNNENQKIIFLLILIILLFNIEFYFYKYYLYCLNCHKKIIENQKCYYCSSKILFKGLQIFSDDTTLNEIINNNKSISRFSDGEFKMIFGKGIGFQDYDNKLSQKLIKVLNSNEKNLLIGLNIPYKEKDLQKLTISVRNYWINYLNRYQLNLSQLINKKRKYYSATISRFYMRYKDKSIKNIKKYIKKLKTIWDHKNILIIEGEKSRLGIGNDLFNNVKSIKRIICPVKNAFYVYDKIIKEVKKLKENRLILIALGPTASILAYDLYKLGYQSIDIGHVDIEYEWFIRNCTKVVPIENKYVNEAPIKFIVKKTKLNNYYNQIISKILK